MGDYDDKSGAIVPGDPESRTGEEIARDIQADDSPDDDSGVNALGDQDAVNSATTYNYPVGAEVPSATNVRRYPELFEQEVIDSFNVPDPNDADADADVDADVDADLDVTTINDDDDSSTSTTVSGDGGF